MDALDKFIIHYVQNAPQVMWLLGAGASRSSGIPTASDIVWELKCRTYCLEQKREFSEYSDYTSPAIRQEVQSFLNSKEPYATVPPEDEYSFYLGLVYKDDPSNLRKFIETKVRNKDVFPSYGHKFLGILLREKLCKIIWTTNFDSLIEDAYAEVGGKPSDLNIAELSGSVLAKRVIDDGSFPLYTKLHGDFRFESIRNLKEELQKNTEFSEALTVACNQYGLAVNGYSGRDESVMKYLNDALDNINPFPKGLHWFIRPGETPLKSVTDLIAKAKAKNIDAEIIEVDNFNELMSRLKKQFTALPEDLIKQHLDRRYELPNIPIPVAGNKYPIIKTNALPILAMPKQCYAFKGTGINNFQDLKVKLEKAEKYPIVTLREDKILSFDYGLHSVLGGQVEGYKITEEMLGDDIEPHFKGFLQKSLFSAIGENGPFQIFTKGFTTHIVVNHRHQNDKRLLPISSAVDSVHRSKALCGKIPDTQMHWAESIRLKLDRNLDRFWILVSPDVWIYDGDKTRETYQEELDTMKAFKKNRLKWRRNFEKARLVNAWQEVLFGSVSKSQAIDINLINTKDISENFSLLNYLASSGRN